MAASDGLTLQQAVGDALGVKLSAYPPLRNAANTLLKALEKDRVFVVAKVDFESGHNNKKKNLISPRDAACLANAVILNGIYAQPKVVVGLIAGKLDRAHYAACARDLLLGRQTVAGIGLVRPELVRLLDMLGSETVDLRTEPLPNPFADALPQMGVGPVAEAGSLLRLVAMQSATLGLGDSMLAYYLDGALEQAYLAAMEVETDSPILMKYKQLIVSEYNEAKAFADLLDEWR